jgi:hypothetical protein
MALNIDTQDLVNYPGTVKTVTVDVDSIVPQGYEGDEKIVMTGSTTAYSDNDNNTAIQDIYVTYLKAGWCKSSGFAGSNGKFALDATHYSLMVKIDNTVSGTDGLGYYQIDLDYNLDSTPIGGAAVADDIETKIRALTMETADTGYALAYKNCSVEYIDGKFYIVSGSISQYYTGSNRSSVRVKAASTNDCTAKLGFDMNMNTEELSSISVKEAALGSDYTTDTTPLTVGAGTGVTAGDCLMITDGTNTDYFTALTGTTDISIVVPTSGTNGFVGIANSYATASGTKIQRLREQDPDGGPAMWYTDMDAVGRWIIKSLVNQIDYSS